MEQDRDRPDACPHGLLAEDPRHAGSEPEVSEHRRQLEEHPEPRVRCVRCRPKGRFKRAQQPPDVGHDRPEREVLVVRVREPVGGDMGHPAGELVAVVAKPFGGQQEHADDDRDEDAENHPDHQREGDGPVSGPRSIGPRRDPCSASPSDPAGTVPVCPTQPARSRSQSSTTSPDCWAVGTRGAWDSLRRMSAPDDLHDGIRHARFAGIRASLERAAERFCKHRHHPALGLADRDRPGGRDRRHRDRDLRPVAPDRGLAGLLVQRPRGPARRNPPPVRRGELVSPSSVGRALPGAVRRRDVPAGAGLVPRAVAGPSCLDIHRDPGRDPRLAHRRGSTGAVDLATDRARPDVPDHAGARRLRQSDAVDGRIRRARPALRLAWGLDPAQAVAAAVRVDRHPIAGLVAGRRRPRDCLAAVPRRYADLPAGRSGRAGRRAALLGPRHPAHARSSRGVAGAARESAAPQ